MRKKASVIFGALVLVAGAAASPAAAQSADARILGEQAGGNRGEVMIATWVRDHAHRAGVRTLARTLIRDHTQGLAQVQSTARGIHVTPSAAAVRAKTSDATRVLRMLQAKRGADMDAAFVSHAVEDHREDIAAAEQAQRQAQSPAVRRLLAATLPVLHRHLTMAQALQGHAGGH